MKITKKQLLSIIGKNGFEVTNRTMQSWKIPYEIKSLNEKYELSVVATNKKQIEQTIKKHLEYWKVVMMDDTTPPRVQEEIENIIKRFRNIIGEINGI